MPDFNYGDFTQQGIENKVTLKARLNERRYVTLDLQSDVEGPNLTISGNVHDELNNIDYPIGSAPNGNIEITENGENINVAPFATATVNVSGGGDLKYCEVTIVCPAEGSVTGLTPVNAEGVMYGINSFHVNNGDKIKCYYTLDEGDIVALLQPANNESAVFEVSDYVNCEPIEEGAPYVIITDTTENSSFTLTVTNWGGGI